MHEPPRLDSQELCIWQDIKKLIETETNHTRQYAAKLLPTLTSVLDNFLGGLRPLYVIIASYSPCNDMSFWTFKEPLYN